MAEEDDADVPDYIVGSAPLKPKKAPRRPRKKVRAVKPKPRVKGGRKKK